MGMVKGAGLVYLLREVGTSTYKVGVTAGRPVLRLRQLQHEKRCRLERVEVVKVRKGRIAESRVLQLCSVIATQHPRGHEWFDIEPRALSKIRAFMRSLGKLAGDEDSTEDAKVSFTFRCPLDLVARIEQHRERLRGMTGLRFSQSQVMVGLVKDGLTAMRRGS